MDERPDGWCADVEGQRLAELARGTVVEIGTAGGRSTSYILEGSPSHVVCVDPWPDDGDYNDFVSWSRGRVTPFRGTSETLARWWEGPIDLLYIDGSHDYEDVRTDYLAWSPFVAPGGWIGFHDSQWRDVQRVIREDVMTDSWWSKPTVTQSLWTAQRG